MDNEKQYHLLIKARNFHYDNFNKWMTFLCCSWGDFCWILQHCGKNRIKFRKNNNSIYRIACFYILALVM